MSHYQSIVKKAEAQNSILLYKAEEEILTPE
jgi:hypothetical protein